MRAYIPLWYSKVVTSVALTVSCYLQYTPFINYLLVGPAANAMMLNNSPQFPGVKKFVEVNPSGDFTSYPRRERFVFRPTHLEVLESFFNSDSYPSQEKRDEIARVCNGSLDLGKSRTFAFEKITL